MTTNHQIKLEALSPIGEGEFWRIRGIREKTSLSLHAHAIHTFAQLGRLSLEELASALPGQIGVKERAARQDWLAQARQLAADAAARAGQRPENAPQAGAEAGARQHYESFKLVLLLNDDGSVRRTHIENIRSRKPEGWAGWDAARLSDWIQAETGLTAPLAPEAHSEDQPQRAVAQRLAALAGAAEIRNTSLARRSTGKPGRFFFQDQALAAHLEVDLSRVQASPGSALEFHASIQACQVGSGALTLVGEAQGGCNPGGALDLCIPLVQLSEGTHHFAAQLLIFPAAHSAAIGPHAAPLFAESDIGMAHIYARELAPVR